MQCFPRLPIPSSYLKLLLYLLVFNMGLSWLPLSFPLLFGWERQRERLYSPPTHTHKQKPTLTFAIFFMHLSLSPSPSIYPSFPLVPSLSQLIYFYGDGKPLGRWFSYRFPSKVDHSLGAVPHEHSAPSLRMCGSALTGCSSEPLHWALLARSHSASPQRKPYYYYYQKNRREMLRLNGLDGRGSVSSHTSEQCKYCSLSVLISLMFLKNSPNVFRQIELRAGLRPRVVCYYVGRLHRLFFCTLYQSPSGLGGSWTLSLLWSYSWLVGVCLGIIFNRNSPSGHQLKGIIKRIQHVSTSYTLVWQHQPPRPTPSFPSLRQKNVSDGILLICRSHQL